MVAKCCSIAEPSEELLKASEVIKWSGFGATIFSLGRSVIKYFDPTPSWKVFTRGKFQSVLSSDWLGFVSTLPSIGCFVASCFVDVGLYETIICNSIPIVTNLLQSLLDGKKAANRLCKAKNEHDKIKEFLSKAIDNKELVTAEMVTDVERGLKVLEKSYHYDIELDKQHLSELKDAIKSQF